MDGLAIVAPLSPLALGERPLVGPIRAAFPPAATNADAGQRRGNPTRSALATDERPRPLPCCRRCRAAPLRCPSSSKPGARRAASRALALCFSAEAATGVPFGDP